MTAAWSEQLPDRTADDRRAWMASMRLSGCCALLSGAEVRHSAPRPPSPDFLVVAACDSIELMERSAVQYAYLTKNDGEGHDATPAHSLVGLAHMALDWFA